MPQPRHYPDSWNLPSLPPAGPSSIGAGVREIRVTFRGAFRVVYVVLNPGRPAVLHAFRKTTQKTSKRDVAIARQRLRELKAANR